MKSLYVTDRRAAGDARFSEVLAALAGAPSLTVQVREVEAKDRERLAWARLARETLAPATPVYVNARFDVALAARAQGVHLPAAGVSISRVRTMTPRGFRVGASTHSAAEAARAIEEGADLVVIGPLYDTPSKRAFGPPLGAAVLAALPRLDEHSAEVYAIGGLDEERLDELEPYRDRVTGVAGIRLFQDSRDPRAIVERIAAR